MNLLYGIVLTTALVLPNEMPDIDAVAAARAAVTASESALGPRHPATAMVLRNLALCYEQAGFYHRAEETATHSLAILESAFGPTDVSLTPVLNVLTETYAAEGRLIEARKVATRAVALGADAEAHYATALYNAGAVFERLCKVESAREYYRQALAAREMWLPAGHQYIELTRAAMERVEDSTLKMSESVRARSTGAGRE